MHSSNADQIKIITFFLKLFWGNFYLFEYIYKYQKLWLLSASSMIHHHHHHVPEGLGMYPVPWSSRWSWSLHLFLGRPMFLLPFGLYCSACFGSLFVSSLCTCCSHFSWYCFILVVWLFVQYFICNYNK